MRAYRYLTGIDDAARGAVICGQAIVKTIESTTYSESLDLSVL